jgi:pheromone a factor receptor
MALRKSSILSSQRISEGFIRLIDYIVQGHRYNIVQYIGCQPTTYVSIPGIFIVWLPSLLLSLGTFVYAGAFFYHPSPAPVSDTSIGIALYHFVQMRVVFSSVLQASNSPMSTNRYMRLIAMSATLMLWGTILTSFTLWANTVGGLRPWISWENVHSNWNRSDAYTWMSMSPQSRTLMLLSWWAMPMSSVILFIFLGFGEDALREYRRVGNVIKSVIPSRVLRRSEKFGKGMLLTSPLSSGFRFVLFPTLRSKSLTFLSDVAPLRVSRHTLRPLLALPRRRQRA